MSFVIYLEQIPSTRNLKQRAPRLRRFQKKPNDRHRKPLAEQMTYSRLLPELVVCVSLRPKVEEVLPSGSPGLVNSEQSLGECHQQHGKHAGNEEPYTAYPHQLLNH